MTTNKPESRHDDKHWLSHLHGGAVESHTEFLLHGHKRVYSQHPSKRSLQNHIVRLSRLIDELRTEQGALQAECEKLRKDADRIDWLADPNNSIGNVQLPMAIVRQHLHSLRDAINAAMELTK